MGLVRDHITKTKWVAKLFNLDYSLIITHNGALNVGYNSSWANDSSMLSREMKIFNFNFSNLVLVKSIKVQQLKRNNKFLF